MEVVKIAIALAILILIICLCAWGFWYTMLYLLLLVVAFVGYAYIHNSITGYNPADTKKKVKANLENAVSELPDISQYKKYISEDYASGIILDETNKIVFVVSTKGRTYSKVNIDIDNFGITKMKSYSYKDILQSEIIEDQNTITQTQRGSQIGGALIGGVLAGGAGAIIGGLSGKTKITSEVSTIELKISVNDLENPVYLINFMGAEVGFNRDNPIPIKKKPIKKDTERYKSAIKNADHWHSLVSVLIKQADEEDKKQGQVLSQTNGSIADELMKLADLLKQGAISQEEYNTLKSRVVS